MVPYMCVGGLRILYWCQDSTGRWNSDSSKSSRYPRSAQDFSAQVVCIYGRCWHQFTVGIDVGGCDH